MAHLARKLSRPSEKLSRPNLSEGKWQKAMFWKSEELVDLKFIKIMTLLHKNYDTLSKKLLYSNTK